MPYAISVVVSRQLPDGWTRTRQLPTFFLDERVQGIVSKEHAEKIARNLIRDAMPDDDPAELVVSAVKVEP